MQPLFRLVPFFILLVFSSSNPLNQQRATLDFSSFPDDVKTLLESVPAMTKIVEKMTQELSEQFEEHIKKIQQKIDNIESLTTDIIKDDMLRTLTKRLYLSKARLIQIREELVNLADMTITRLYTVIESMDTISTRSSERRIRKILEYTILEMKDLFEESAKILTYAKKIYEDLIEQTSEDIGEIMSYQRNMTQLLNYKIDQSRDEIVHNHNIEKGFKEGSTAFITFGALFPFGCAAGVLLSPFTLGTSAAVLCIGGGILIITGSGLTYVGIQKELNLENQELERSVESAQTAIDQVLRDQNFLLKNEQGTLKMITADLNLLIEWQTKLANALSLIRAGRDKVIDSFLDEIITIDMFDDRNCALVKVCTDFLDHVFVNDDQGRHRFGQKLHDKCSKIAEKSCKNSLNGCMVKLHDMKGEKYTFSFSCPPVIGELYNQWSEETNAKYPTWPGPGQIFDSEHMLIAGGNVDFKDKVDPRKVYTIVQLPQSYTTDMKETEENCMFYKQTWEPDYNFKRIPDRKCTATDVSDYMISKTSTGIWDVKFDLVAAFVEIQGDKDAEINDLDLHGKNPFQNISTEGTKAMLKDENPQGAAEYTEYQIIPWSTIGVELFNLKSSHRPFTREMYEKVHQGLNMIIGASKYKTRTWHAALEKIKFEIETECEQGGIMLEDAVENFAHGLNYLIRWTPNNCYLGPNFDERIGNPKDMIDMAILKTLNDNAQQKFTVDQATNHLKNNQFRYEKANWKTIVELLADIDNGPGFLGPLWTKFSSAPDSNQPKKVWDVKGSKNKICYADFIGGVYGERCPGSQSTAYIEATTGKLLCAPVNLPNVKFESLCED